MLGPTDRDYVLGRLDANHVSTLAKEIRNAIFHETLTPIAIEACYQPGDATWYALIFAPIQSLRGAPGGGTAGAGATSYCGPGVFVGHLQAMEAGVGGGFVVSPDFRGADLETFEWMVNEKAPATTPGSAVALAALLVEVFA